MITHRIPVPEHVVEAVGVHLNRPEILWEKALLPVFGREEFNKADKTPQIGIIENEGFVIPEERGIERFAKSQKGDQNKRGKKYGFCCVVFHAFTYYAKRGAAVLKN